MANITPQMMLSFQDELEKQAVDIRGLASGAKQFLGRQGTAAGSGAVMGGLAGGGLGASVLGAKGYQEARERGATGGEAAGEALSGAWKGLKGGALLGAGAGAAGGLAGGARARGLVSKLRKRDDMLGGVSRFGERQVHSLTGAAPRATAGGLAGGGRVEAVRSMRAGSYPAMEKAQKAVEKFHGAVPGKAKDKALKELKAARGHLDTATKAEEMGITNLPGYLKGLVGRGKYIGGAREGQRFGAGEALKTGLKEQWRGTGTGVSGTAMKGLLFGLPAAGVASELATPNEPGGEGRFVRAGKSLGTLAYGMAPIPIAGMEALSRGLQAGGGLVGKGIQKATKTGPQQAVDPSKRLIRSGRYSMRRRGDIPRGDK